MLLALAFCRFSHFGLYTLEILFWNTINLHSCRVGDKIWLSYQTPGKIIA